MLPNSFIKYNLNLKNISCQLFIGLWSNGVIVSV